MQLELKALQREVGITFVYVTHDQEEALTMSDVIVVMRDGLIQQQGRPEELYQRPVNRFVAGFIGSSNFIEGASPGGPDDAGRVGVSIAGACRLAGLLTDAQRPAAGPTSRSPCARRASSCRPSDPARRRPARAGRRCPAGS